MNHLNITAASVFNIIEQTYLAKGTEKLVGRGFLIIQKVIPWIKLSLVHRAFQCCLESQNYKHVEGILPFFCIKDNS